MILLQATCTSRYIITTNATIIMPCHFKLADLNKKQKMIMDGINLQKERFPYFQFVFPHYMNVNDT